MHIFRKIAFQSVSALFFILLLFVAWSTAANLTFSKPGRIENWLQQSKVYYQFVATAIQQAEKSSSTPNGTISTSQGFSLSLNDPGVQQAADSAFTPEILQNASNEFINANYEWLQGKTTSPSFHIDLSQAKENFITNLSNYVSSRASTLPVCTEQQLLTTGANFDPLTATCLPVGVTPASAAQMVKQQMTANQNFLPNPVITAENINQVQIDNNASSQPYYVKLSQLPKVYSLANTMPWIIGALSMLSALGLVFLAATRRKGLRRIGSVLVSAGLVTVVLALASNYIFTRAEHTLVMHGVSSVLQKSLIDVAHHVQMFMAGVNLWFGIGFFVVGVAILLVLRFLYKEAKPMNEPSADDKQTEHSEPAAN